MPWNTNNAYTKNYIAEFILITFWFTIATFKKNNVGDFTGTLGVAMCHQGRKPATGNNRYTFSNSLNGSLSCIDS